MYFDMDFSFDWLMLLFSKAYEFLMSIALFFNVKPNDVLTAWGAIGGNGGGFRGDYVASVLNVFSGEYIDFVFPLEGVLHEIYLPVFQLLNNLELGGFPLWVIILNLVVTFFIVRVVIEMIGSIIPN